MPFNANYLNVSVLPHVFSRMDPKTKSLYRNKYKKIKRVGSFTAINAVAANEGTQLAKDLISSKLRAYGYKSLFAILGGPIMQLVSLPLYVFSYGTKVRRLAVAMTETGALISKGEMGVINWSWIGFDIMLFGEPIPITDGSDFMIIHNETVGHLSCVINDIIGEDE